mgnify:CR=1 FL=1
MLTAKKRAINNTFTYILLVITSIILMLPLYYLIITSFKTFQESIAEFKWLPSQFNFDNYKEVLSMEEFRIVRYFLNTMYIIVLKTGGALLTCSIAAYGFVRYQYKYKELIFSIFMSVLMLPVELLTIPYYEIFLKLNWMDSYKPMYISAFFATDVFAIFLFRQFFRSVPNSLFEAARIDGCGEFRMYLRIMLPLSKPVFITMFLLYFTGTYNDIYQPTLYILSEEKYTLSQSIQLIENLYNTGSRDYLVPWNLVSAATFISIIPVIAVFFTGQKYFIEGVATAGIKG